MPLWLQIVLPTILAPAFSTAIAFIVTAALNSPKRLREKREAEKEAQRAAFENYKQELGAMIETLKSERSQERQVCGREHAEVIERLEAIKQENRIQSLGLQSVIKNTLKIQYEKWLSKGYAPIDAKDDLEKMYQSYHNLGANGVMDSLRTQFLALPDERVAKRRRKNGDDVESDE